MKGWAGVRGGKRAGLNEVTKNLGSRVVMPIQHTKATVLVFGVGVGV
jgi:hypothetical protein